jgi:hypothetical protein
VTPTTPQPAEESAKPDCEQGNDNDIDNDNDNDNGNDNGHDRGHDHEHDKGKSGDDKGRED